MRPYHPSDQLRLAEERQRELGEQWPPAVGVRQTLADALRRIALRLDPPSGRTGRVVGPAVRR